MEQEWRTADGASNTIRLFQKSEQVERKQLEEKLHSRVPLLRPLLLSRVPIKWFSNEITRLIIHFKGGPTLFLKNI